jgi:hypothetical protein
MRELTVATRTEGAIVYEWVAIVNVRDLREAGICEASFRAEVASILGGIVVRSAIRETVRLLSDEPTGRGIGSELAA